MCKYESDSELSVSDIFTLVRKSSGVRPGRLAEAIQLGAFSLWKSKKQSQEQPS